MKPIVVIAFACTVTFALAQPVPVNPSPQYKAAVPDSIRTPDSVQTTTLGTLQFFDGMPSADTVAKTYDYLDVARAAQTFLAGVPAASAYSALEGFKAAGMQPCDLGIAEDRLDARSLFLTPNTTTVYGMVEIDVKDGPVIVDIPAGVLGPVADIFFRYVVDFGPVGPDKGKGGEVRLRAPELRRRTPAGCLRSPDAHLPQWRLLSRVRQGRRHRCRHQGSQERVPLLSVGAGRQSARAEVRQPLRKAVQYHSLQ